MALLERTAPAPARAAGPPAYGSRAAAGEAFRPRRLGRAVVPIALAAALVAWVVPRVAGAPWGDIAGALGRLGVLELAAITALWLAGLWVHTLALTAAMPGLSSRRAFFLNITGSSVSNILPLGGAAGTVLNYTMSRSWGFTPAAFARWALLTNIWDVLVKLALPGLALTGLALARIDAGHDVSVLAGAGVVLLVVFAAAAGLLSTGDSGARALGRAADWVAVRVRRPCRDAGGYAGSAVSLRRDSAVLIASAWGRLTVGKVAYAALQAALLWLCLSCVGRVPALAVVFAAFAVERLLSLAVITPGATGIVEVGMTGVLGALGADAASAAAGVLLYRAFTVGMEIPVGGAGLLWWSLRRPAGVRECSDFLSGSR
jgi:uncharacterized membrane protein YbhN (UPF0104 family)